MFLKVTGSFDIQADKQSSSKAIELRHEYRIQEQGIVHTGSKINNHATAKYSRQQDSLCQLQKSVITWYTIHNVTITLCQQNSG